jgi:hypothetical protein
VQLEGVGVILPDLLGVVGLVNHFVVATEGRARRERQQVVALKRVAEEKQTGAEEAFLFSWPQVVSRVVPQRGLPGRKDEMGLL